MAFLFNDDSWGRFVLPILTVFIGITYGVLINYILKKKRKISQERRNQVLVNIEQAIDINPKLILSDLILLYEGTMKKSFDISNSAPLLNCLKEVFAKLITDLSSKEKLDCIKDIIEELETNEPFSQINEPERTIFKDAIVFIKNRSIEDSERKVLELSNLVHSKQETIKEFESNCAG